MKKLDKKQKKQFDELLKSIGKSLIGTMEILKIPNYIKSEYATEENQYTLIFKKHFIERTTDKLLIELGFIQEKENNFFHIELDAKGFIVRWIEELNDYFIEQKENPTARIKVSSKLSLQDAFKLITDRNLFND